MDTRNFSSQKLMVEVKQDVQVRISKRVILPLHFVKIDPKFWATTHPPHPPPHVLRSLDNTLQLTVRTLLRQVKQRTRTRSGNRIC